MNTRKNARLTPHGRALLVARVIDEGLRPREVAQAQGVSVRTVYKWARRFREEGHAGLQDRTSSPERSPFATDAATVEQVIERRQQRQIYRQIALALGICQSTVACLLRREGLNRLAALSPARPDNRYEHDAPGGLLHLDIKKLRRFERPGHRLTGDRQQNTPGAGWEYVHVAIDDHSRLAFSSLHPDARSPLFWLLRLSF
ncbi:hypothetical protein BOX17_08850 [Halomonas aestuarii]|uniref:DNA-binding domain-containing protein n=1 Tax=Halomonas aestuarii TaxID=1897729 RepID=A0A1J0VG99_9GAMM|nr:hypothetical protein BOX17_08850 [Halomonas aestuarii]